MAGAIRTFSRLSELLDTSLTSPVSGEALIFNGTTWESSEIPTPTVSTITHDDCSVTTSELIYQQTWTGTIELGKVCIPETITATAPCWVRVYKDETYMAADAGRAQTTDVTGEHGVLMEFILTEDNLTWGVSPQFSIASAAAEYPISVRSLYGTPTTVTINVTRAVIQLY